MWGCLNFSTCSAFCPHNTLKLACRYDVVCFLNDAFFLQEKSRCYQQCRWGNIFFSSIFYSTFLGFFGFFFQIKKHIEIHEEAKWHKWLFARLHAPTETVGQSSAPSTLRRGKDGPYYQSRLSVEQRSSLVMCPPLPQLELLWLIAANKITMIIGAREERSFHLGQHWGSKHPPNSRSGKSSNSHTMTT